MKGTYSKLLGMKTEKEKPGVKKPIPPEEDTKVDLTGGRGVEQDTAQNNEHKSAQVNEQTISPIPNLPSNDDVETLSFSTRKDPKVKVNTEIPIAWKADIDDIAHRLKVGKYELLAYIIGQFLNKVG